MAAKHLFRPCDLGDLQFETVTDLPDPPGLIGQERAVEAVEFSVGIRRKGFNLFVLGPSGTGRHTLVREFLQRKAASESTPADWCYVNNFTDPHRPRRLMLPAGRARPLRDSMDRLVADLRVSLPAAFERDDYRTRHEALEQQLKKRHEDAFGDLQRRAESMNIALVRTPIGLALAPMQKGEVLNPEVFKRLDEAERNRIEDEIEHFQAELEAIVRQIPDWEREHREAVRKLNRETTAQTVRRPLEELRKSYAGLPEVLDYLAAVERDILEHAEDFLASNRPESDGADQMAQFMSEMPTFRRYRVNVMVDNSETKGAPVVFEDHPTHQTLVGRIEHMARFGALVTDFSLLVPGALHRANGGYLIVDIERLLMGAFGYDSLKRALRSGEISIVSLEHLLSLASTVALEPEPIPLDVKVVLIGAPIFYYLLAELDSDFKELFKVAADFNDRIERSLENSGLYARVIASAVRREKLRPFDRGAVGCVIEHCSRQSGDSERLSTQMRNLIDLLQEADYVAGAASKTAVGVAEVQAAVEAQHRRADRIYRRIQEEIGRDTIHIETAGEHVGQVNGLAVLSLGGFSFGNPSRITARVRVGKGEVIDIEREVALGGPLHSKGVLILAGFLGGRFGKSGSLSLTASLVFEQSYGGIDGDSASSAELYALLSALADMSIRQCYAVTGSVDQHGNVQAIGGVNEKIEGFFDICQARGLDGRQGVLIPAANVKHLMLRQDVVNACTAGKFAVIPVETIDQGIEILTGMPAGLADVTGQYPEGTVNQRVTVRLAAFAAQASRLAMNEPRQKRSKKERRDD
ncbi:MAG: Lon protease family protein [Bradyrhizobium sp.]